MFNFKTIIQKSKEFAASISFGSDAVEKYKISRHPDSPGGKDITPGEALAMFAPALAHLEDLAGSDKVIDISLLPTKNEIAMIFEHSGYTVINNGDSV